MKRIAIASGLALVLAACSGGDADADANGDGTISSEEARTKLNAAGDQIRPEPGQYKMDMTFVKADIPGAPKEMLDMLGRSMTNSFEYCLTQEQADKGFEESLTQGQDDSCEMTKMEISGGDIDMAMSCSDPNTGKMEMTMKGTVTSTTSDLAMVTKGNVAGMGSANIEMKMSQKRIGDCPA